MSTHTTLPFSRTASSNGRSTGSPEGRRRCAASVSESLRDAQRSDVERLLAQRQRIGSRLEDARENLQLAIYANAAGDDTARDRLWKAALVEIELAADNVNGGDGDA